MTNEEQTGHHASSEGAQQHVEPERLGDPHEQNAQQHAEAHTELPARVQRARDQADDPRLGGPCRQPSDEQRDRAEAQQHSGGLRRRVRRQRHRDREDRSEFTHRTAGQDVAPKCRGQHTGVPKDRQQRADRCGGECDCDEADTRGDVERMQHDGHAGAEAERQHPTTDSQLHRPPLHRIRVDLETGQEDEQHQPHLGQHLDHLVEVRPTEYVRSDEDPEEDLDHHTGHAGPAFGEVGDERAECRDRHDQHE
ncbi:unannotated protein [freshwater metagenome]|uniref:Unannotated protein n=1 Tax=freshwater metagenome TaxID=449393 RepID=A0A6J7QZT3_9ZZZZ